MITTSKTNFIFLALIIFLTGKIQSQDYKTINGDTITHSKYFLSSEIIAQDESGFYFLEHNAGRGGECLTKISVKNAKVIFRIELPKPEKYYAVIAHELVNGKMLMFYAVEGRNNKKLLAIEIDLLSGKVLGDFKQIDAISQIFFNLGSHGTLAYHVIFSPDKSKVAVFSEVSRLTDEGNIVKERESTVKLFNTKQFDMLWEKQLQSSYGSIMAITDFVLTNDGYFYYIFNFFKNQSSFYGRQGISMIGENSNTGKVYELENTSDTRSIINSNSRLFLRHDKLFCSGFFVDGDKTKYLSNGDKFGFFLTVIDAKSLKVISQNYSYSNGQIETKYPDNLTGLVTSSILEGEDGSYYLVKSTTPIRNWQYGEIGVFKYNKNFNLEWMRVIPRYVYSATWFAGTVTFKDEPLVGFNFMKDEEGFKFFYSDHKKNLEKFPDIMQEKIDDHVLLTKSKDAVLVCTTVNAKGVLSRKKISQTNQTLIFGESGDEEKLWIKNSGSILIKNYLAKGKRSYSIFNCSKP